MSDKKRAHGGATLEPDRFTEEQVRYLAKSMEDLGILEIRQQISLHNSTDGPIMVKYVSSAGYVQIRVCPREYGKFA